MKCSTEKIIEGADKMLTDDIKCRKIGTLVICAGVGLIIISYIK